jgi:hypothetical protein
MSNFYDEVCEYSYSTPVTENFSNDVNVQEKDQCVINGPYLKLKNCIDICDKTDGTKQCKSECITKNFESILPSRSMWGWSPRGRDWD